MGLCSLRLVCSLNERVCTFQGGSAVKTCEYVNLKCIYSVEQLVCLEVGSVETKVRVGYSLYTLNWVCSTEKWVFMVKSGFTV